MPPEVTETGADKELSVYRTNGGMRRGTGLVVAQKETTKQGRKGSKSMEGETHLELMHSNIFAMKPI